MSNLRDSWMSCRQAAHSRSSRLELLPTFTPPPPIHDFSIENRPPSLPQRNSSSRICLLFVGSVLCLVGSYATIAAAAGPVIEHGSSLARGVSTVVGKAISQANQEAERNAKMHYEAHERYMSKRRTNDNIPTTMERESTILPKSPLLIRLSALQTSGKMEIDNDAVEQLFPDWVSKQENSWNEGAVLNDLILAVSQISHALSIDNRKE